MGPTIRKDIKILLSEGVAMSKLQTLTQSECDSLLTALIREVPSVDRTNKGIRNYTMALLMLDAGLRVGEVVQLKVPDLMYLEQPIQTLRIRAEIAKRHTERMIPLSSRIKNAIVFMEKNIWQKPIATIMQYAFYLQCPSRHITTRQVERIISSAGVLSIGRKVNPHVLRHTFASKLMRQVNARIVQELLGHKNLSSTQIYTHPNGEDLAKTIEGMNE